MSNWATHFSINLNDQVDRNMNIPPHRDSSAIVFQGTLRSDGTRLAVKTVCAGLPAGNQETIEVLAVRVLSAGFDSAVGGSSRNASMVRTAPREYHPTSRDYYYIRSHSHIRIKVD